MKHFIFSILVLFYLTNSQAQSGTPSNNVSDEVTQLAADGKLVPIVVEFKAKADLGWLRQVHDWNRKGELALQVLSETSEASQAQVRAYLRLNNISYTPYKIANVIALRANAANIQWLAGREEVRYIHHDQASQGRPNIRESRSTPLQARTTLLPWGIQDILADSVWRRGYTGQGVVIAGHDTGYDWQHPALKSRYRGWDGTTADHNYNWHDGVASYSPLGDSINRCGLNSPFPCDDGSHGTHTMGTMLGSPNPDTMIGVAPGAQWIGCRNMEDGNGQPSTYIDCFEWFLAPTDLSNGNPDPSKRPHVINNSWYCSSGEGCNTSNYSFMQTAIQNLQLAGIVVVISAGNSGSACGSISEVPAMFEESFSVGATNSADEIAGFSSRGPVTVDGSNRLKPEVSAPGVDVLSSTNGGGYAAYSGTSMAGPHVAGLVALVISVNPWLAGRVSEIEHIIKSSARPAYTQDTCGTSYGTNRPNHAYGWGIVNAVDAMTAALALQNTEAQANSNELIVFPNPANNWVEVILDTDTHEDSQLLLFDNQGKLVMQQPFGGKSYMSLNLDGISNGLYFYQVTNGKQQWSGKISIFRN